MAELKHFFMFGQVPISSVLFPQSMAELHGYFTYKILDQHRKALWENRKAGALLGSTDSLSGIIGKDLDELGVKLLDDRSWASVLNDIELLQSGDTCLPADRDLSLRDGLQVLVKNESKWNNQKRSFRVCIELLNGDHGLHFILSFESLARMEGASANSGTESIPNSKKTQASLMRDDNFCALRNAVFDNVDTAAFLQTVDGESYLANRKAREILGECVGGESGCEGTIFRDALQIWDETFTRQLPFDEYPGVVLAKTQRPFADYRCGFIHPISGDRITTIVTGECLYDVAGAFLGAICWCEEIQKFEDYLMEKQQNLLRSHETICDLMPHLVWTTTPDGYGDWYSKRWYEYTGMSEEECLDTGYRRTIHPDDWSFLVEKWEEGRRTRQQCEVEVRYLRHDGVYRWMHTRAQPLVDGNGNVLKWYGTNTDITDVVMSRIEAKRNKHQMLTVLAHAEVSLFCVDENRLVTMAEGGMLWGTKPENLSESKANLIGKDIIEIMQGTQTGGLPGRLFLLLHQSFININLLTGHENSILQILAGKVEMATCEEKIGDRSYRTRLVADLEHSSDDGGQVPKVIGCLGLSIDITDVEKRAQLEIDNTRLMLEEQAAKDSSKMKSQFLANGIIGMVDLLSEDTTLTSSQREYVSSIQLSGRALLTIVNDILDFSKIESGRLDIEEVPFNLCSIVGELCKLLSIFANKKNLGFTYENEVDEDLEVLGDPGRIRQVLSNLLTNSLKFTENGSVKMSVKGKRIPQSDSIGNDRVEISFVITDTGIGISKTTLKKLFKPFSQGDSSTARLYGGTGLGLTISRNLASLMSGTIALKSEEGVGSIATFTIPLKISSYCRYPHQSTDPYKPSSSFTSNKFSTQSRASRLNGVPAGGRQATQQFINQQISTSHTNHVMPSYLRNGKCEVEYRRKFSLEERAEVLVLVVEDNAINQTIALRTVRNLGFQATAVWNGREALDYLSNPGLSKPRPDIILMDVQMPIMDGMEATRILRTNKEYEKDPELDMPTPEAANNFTSTGSPDGSKMEMKSSVNRSKPNTVVHQKQRKVRDLPVIAMTASAIEGDEEKCIEAGMDGYLSKPVEKERLEETLIYWAQKTINDRQLGIGILNGRVT
ncbi:hypothetical protein SS1G_07900 [Sclerotinia sclerotiorum 1980 UF-70]|uniref:Histidine kinase n=1 Tax=Sclerotinia sclerotiorum (strain ATCC 18683 / 1980 / Ss-1) TaxID=665079 RepID=A7ERE6_SCLS1|nr:hypothetical protein SS1G_07900 [Sclerotinia sclerotiorum 1980 UF-70]EDN92038.1 hypothetical protein SS1G_07900 [Sclerotinia sclerotiorum 1980 UF-70]